MVAQLPVVVMGSIRRVVQTQQVLKSNTLLLMDLFRSAHQSMSDSLERLV